MKQHLLLLTLIFFIGTNAYAQSKPKRDKTKDNSVIVAKQKAAAKAQAAKVAEEKRRKELATAKKRKSKPAPPKKATFLYVDNSLVLFKKFNYGRDSEVFYVRTDGKEWNVTCLPSWCNITKYDDRFVVNYSANDSYEDRFDWFKVISDNQEVRVNITQSAAPINIVANINSANLEHNVTITDKTQYLKVDANVSVCGAGGLPCKVIAFITDEYGNNIKASSLYPAYSIGSSNDVGAYANLKPTSNYTGNYNVTMYLPNNAMLLSKKNQKLRCKLYFYCDKNSKYVDGVNYSIEFTAKSKKGKVTTKRK